MLSAIKNIIVVGGSYVGRATAQELAQTIPPTHRVLLIEPHTHFHHIFTFPRFAVVSGQEHKAFIPYSGTFSSAPNEASHAVVPARVLSVQSRSLKLDREWQGSDEIQFDYLVVATGTTLTPPATTKHDEKLPSIMCLRKHQEQVKRANSILVVGGGAAGVQTAADIKECYPDKQVTLVHSRDRLMPKFDPKLHDIIKRRFDELGISLITGARVVIPPGGFPSTNQTSFDVRITNAPTVSAEFVILATGQQPNNLLVANLGSSSSGQSIINPKNGFIRVRPTLQLADSMYDHLFAVGDIADTGLHKAARPGVAQARVAAQNILALLEGRLPGEEFPVLPPAIHITLGMKYNVLFVDPDLNTGRTEPKIVEKYDGREDMNVDSMWQRLGIHVESPTDYHL